MPDRVGQQLGNYRLTRLLGRGGFADVYLGEHLYLKNRAALKVLRTSLADEDVEQFLAYHGVGTKARLALALLLFTGARRQDMVTFGKQHVRNDWIRQEQEAHREQGQASHAA